MPCSVPPSTGCARVASRSWPAACSTCCVRACCCWPTASSPATSCGDWPAPPARIWPGGSRGTRCCVPLRRLPDGSFLSVMNTPAEPALHPGSRSSPSRRPPLPGPPPGHPMRIIEYTVTVQTATATAKSSRSDWSPASSTRSQRRRRSWPRLSPAVGEREPLRRVEDAAARLRLRLALTVTADGPPGVVRFPRRLPGALRPAIQSGRYGWIDSSGSRSPSPFVWPATRRRPVAATAAGLRRACQQTIADLLEDRLPARRARPRRADPVASRTTYRSRRHDHVAERARSAHARRSPRQPLPGARLK